MAGENTIGPTDASSIDATTEAANKASEALGIMNTIGYEAKSVFHDFQSKIQSFGLSLKTNAQLTENQAAAFGVLSAAIIGTRKSFDQLSGIDTGSLDTFKGQWTDLTNIIKNSPFAQPAIEQMKAALKALGKSDEEIKKAAENGIVGLSKLGESFMESADNALRLQNAMVQLASRTGNLGNIIKAAGPNLEDMNTLLAQQQDVISKSAAATRLSSEAVEKYYAQLGTIPRALESTINTNEAAGESVSMLTATINYAKGAGRTYQDVIDDLKVALRDYNLTGEDALKFTARMGELSSKFGVELVDVQSSLRETAGLFKMFGNEAEGAAKMVNNYLGELQKTGISGKTALEVINGMTQGIKGMSLAQKGFLSAQTGGAGGLMGAFQIEKLLRDGKLDEVMDKVQQQMSKQFGRIVTLDDAANSPQAAAQLTKQMMILQQGPLGKFAKDDQSAMRLLEAFKAREAGGPASELSKSIVQDTMKTGVDLQEKSVTELTRIRELLQGNQNFANIANLTTMQHAFTAGVGTQISSPTGDYNRDLRDNLKESGRSAGLASGEATKNFGDTKNNLGIMGADVINSYQDLFKELGPALKGPVNKIMDMLKSGNTGGAHKEYEQFLSDIEKKKEELKNAPMAARTVGMQRLSQEENQMKAAYASMSVNNGNMSKLPITNARMNFGAADAVNRAANRSVTPATGGQPAAGGAHVAHGPISGEITVQVEGYCIDCGSKMKNQQHRKSVSVGSSIDK